MNNINLFKNGIEFLENHLQLEINNKSSHNSIISKLSNIENYLKTYQSLIPNTYYEEVINSIRQIRNNDKNISSDQINALFLKLTHLKESLQAPPIQPNPLDIPLASRGLHQLERQMEAITRARKDLTVLKTLTQTKIQQNALTPNNTVEFSRYIGSQFNKILQNLFLHAMKKLEAEYVEGPDLSKWTVVVLGSLAREEGHPYSDIDLVILTDPELETDEKAQKYFQRLMQEVADAVHQIGEEAHGFKLCEGNLTPPYQPYDERYNDSGIKSSKKAGGMGTFIASPQRLALAIYESAIPLRFKYNSVLVKPQTGNENLIGAALLDTKPIVGSDSLYRQFCDLKKYLGEKKAKDVFDMPSGLPWDENISMEQLAMRSILGTLVQKRSATDYSRDVLNLKKDFMRPIQMGVSVLANQLGIKESNTIGRLNEMVKRNLLSQQDMEAIQQVYLNIYKMRLEEAVHLGAENDEIVVNERAYADMENRLKIMEEELLSYRQKELELAHKPIMKGDIEQNDNRQMQTAYFDACEKLLKRMAMGRKADPKHPELLKATSLCCKVLHLLNRYIAIHCDANKLKKRPFKA